MAKYRITAPDGKTFDIEGEGSQEEALAHFQSTYKEGPAPKQLSAADALAGPDIMAAAASGGVATPLSGLAGIAGTILPGPQGQGASWQQKVQDALTIQPKTRVGEIAMGAAAAPFELLHKGAVKAGQAAQEKLGFEPAGATAVQTAIETLPALGLMAMGSKGQAPQVAAKQSLNEVRDATYASARKEGYTFPPSATEGGAINARVEGMAGRPMLNQEITLKNQTVTNRIAAKEAGLPENTAITPGRLETRRQQLAAPYREIAAIDQTVAADLSELRQVRADAKKWNKFFDRTSDPRVEKRAQRLSDRAEVLEGYIEEAATNAGKPDLVARLRQARKEIAKTYDIEAALNEGSADISASKIASMLDKGKPLSGGLETIAKAHQAFRPYMGDATAIRNPGVERVRSGVGIAANAAGMHGGIGWLSEGLPMAAGPTRSIIMSDKYQNSFGKPSYGEPSLTPNLAAILGALAEGNNNRK